MKVQVWDAVRMINETLPTANALQEFPIHGGNVKNVNNDIRKWLRDNEILN
jgi:hypothetical protein